ncbi:Putative DNA-3-methyladenine glycosylase [Penicillium brasilianum]|uniref:Putative DNA-3-methyladenine glycosylase n=1 Tax=Penicillium brasilianum TaxID=104259 RepID=A0A0F7U1D4_PENBI|nr:Putative DNA-3-methyladenine glycosylase [Penicillium brasilianum]
MSLRRSARLGALPVKPLLPNVPRVQHSGVAKPRKTSKPKKTSTTQTPTDSTSSYWSPEPPAVTDSTDDPEKQRPPRTNNRLSTPPPLNRPVDPHRTNATLLTPHGSSVNAYPINLEDASPSKTGLPRPTATTGTLLEQGIAHLLATDPRLKTVIEQHPCPLFSPTGLAEQIDPFNSLVSSIIGQQVSGAAAKSIRKKFVALFELPGEADAGAVPHSRFPTPQEVARCDIPMLRTAGLSQRKAEYIQGLAEKFASGELSAQILATASDEELVERLTAVRGLGRWSVEMFACFALKRIDVFSTGDLGVQRGCAAFVGRDVSKLKGKGGGKFKYMSEKDMLELAAKFAPYRSLFMWYMWRIENVDVAVLTG